MYENRPYMEHMGMEGTVSLLNDEHMSNKVGGGSHQPVYLFGYLDSLLSKFGPKKSATQNLPTV